ncbi:tyrosine-protein phosphatase [Mammaliicoccus sciuri]|uniref:tyrosine-protein phosphatase n=1 Tax=Mammaliicoccus sciuri TaxID=1296 RepID=UPI00194F3B89
MIDIHNHLLMGLDDGAQSYEETISLLQQAKEQGITGVVVTPHHLHPKYNNKFSKVESKLNQLKQYQQIVDYGIDLYVGQEIRIKDQVLDDIDNQFIQGINHSRYILIEFPSNSIPNYTKNLLYEVQNKGFIPIIAHPERNKAIVSNPNLLYELVNNGALSQVTSSSLTGELGKNIQNISIKLIDHNLIHFIASDAHHPITRPFIMSDLFSISKLKKVEDKLHELIRNNEFIIRDEEIVRTRPKEIKKNKFFGLF